MKTELTARETEVAILTAQGYPNKRTANKFGIGKRTVEERIANVYQKWEIHTAEQLTYRAIHMGLVIVEKFGELKTYRLTPRELQVLALIAQNEANKTIGERLGIRIRTVETHRDHINKKLGLKDKDIAQSVFIIHFALFHGLIDLVERNGRIIAVPKPENPPINGQIKTPT